MQIATLLGYLGSVDQCAVDVRILRRLVGDPIDGPSGLNGVVLLPIRKRQYRSCDSGNCTGQVDDEISPGCIAVDLLVV